VEDLSIFQLFPKLPAEIRLRIWKLSFPCTRAIRVRPLVDKDRPLSYRENTSREVLNIRFSYTDDPIMALQISRESRKAGLSIYRPLVAGGRTIYFCPDRDVFVFEGLDIVYQKLVLYRGLATTMRLLENTITRELTDQFADLSTIEWVAPFLRQVWERVSRVSAFHQ
jgi:hypothetical protein